MSCPHCGEPVEPRQLVCLNCGGRVALRERTPLAREPATALAAALVVVIVIGAGLFGFAISELTSGDGDGGGGGSDRADAGATERRSGDGQPEARAGEPQAPAVVAGEEQEPKQPEEPAVPRRERGVPGWPKGLTAHTVVLVTSSDRAAALGVAKEARSRGLEAGLMPSDPYDLGTGLWIVYSGRFTTPEGAQRQASQLAGRYPGAYPQLIQRSQ
jgi:DNA-directed RNA polymerase subunit RPC12/RpoP